MVVEEQGREGRLELLRSQRHVQSCRVTNQELREGGFVANMGDPQVPIDIPRNVCDPHGTWSRKGSGLEPRWQEWSRVKTSARRSKNGHLVINHTGSGTCGNNGKQRPTMIICTCDKSESLETKLPLARHEHASMAESAWLTVFKLRQW